ncbi:MAG: hypothetical protein Q9170_006575 [Blastenia crenularia]
METHRRTPEEATPLCNQGEERVMQGLWPAEAWLVLGTNHGLPRPKAEHDPESLFGFSTVGALALRTGQDAVIEIHARAHRLERPARSVRRYFDPGDILSPEELPIPKGACGLWKGVERWDQDLKIFSGKGKGKMAGEDEEGSRRGIKLWDQDSKVFLREMGEGKMTRVVERMDSDCGGGGRWLLVWWLHRIGIYSITNEIGIGGMDSDNMPLREDFEA